MNHLVCPSSVINLPYNRTEYTLLPLPSGTVNFTQDAAAFFVQSWMSSALSQMLHVWQNWSSTSPQDKQEYISYLDVALLSEGKLIDEPTNGYTNPMATFSETMLRWLRQNFAPKQLLVEPAVPQPPGDGKIDLVEVTGLPGDYSSMAVTLWEVKSSDGEASEHNSKIYRQLCDYPRRFYHIANHMATTYTGTDSNLKLFLRDMAKLVRNHSPQAHYGVFITYHVNVTQKVNIVPNLHKYPTDYFSPSRNTHTLAILLIPNFKKLRLDIWRSLHLI